MNKLNTVDPVSTPETNTIPPVAPGMVVENNAIPPELITMMQQAQQHQTHEPETTKGVYDYPTEIVTLPSKGLLYPKDNPLSQGYVEIKYMTTREEDILSTPSYIQQGVVLDKLCEAIIVTKGVKFNDLLLGDKNAILFAARTYGYGPMYQTQVTTDSGNTIPITVDLRQLSTKEIDESLIIPGENRFKYTLPSGKSIEFKLLTVRDQKEIDNEIKALKKLGPNYPVSGLTIRLKKMIISINGSTNPMDLTTFVENMLASDSRAFREYITKVQPDVDLSVEVEDPETGEFFRGDFTIGVDLFYPDFKG